MQLVSLARTGFYIILYTCNPYSVQDEADDFVIATGETHSVREFCEVAFGCAGMTLHWKGSGTEVAFYVVCQRAGSYLNWFFLGNRRL